MMAFISLSIPAFVLADEKELSKEPPLCGDANHDGKVTAADATRIQSVARGKRKLKKNEPNTFDLNIDGKIDQKDWETAMAIAIGKIKCAPCPAAPKSCPADNKSSTEQL
jgi:hypothetical protein